MKTIAITGGIGSGKSLAGELIKNKGYIVIDADNISRDLTAKGKKGYEGIVKVFGESFLKEDGTLDRKKLADKVFSNKESLNKLNKVMHPLIEIELDKLLESYNDKQYVFILMPLLFELGWQNHFDKVWLILVDEKIRILRVMQRDKSKQSDVKKRIKNQIIHENIISIAHNVLYNNSSKEEFKASIVEALKTL